jgi:hypothetical protein
MGLGRVTFHSSVSPPFSILALQECTTIPAHPVPFALPPPLLPPSLSFAAWYSCQMSIRAGRQTVRPRSSRQLAQGQAKQAWSQEVSVRQAFRQAGIRKQAGIRRQAFAGKHSGASIRRQAFAVRHSHACIRKQAFAGTSCYEKRSQAGIRMRRGAVPPKHSVGPRTRREHSSPSLQTTCSSKSRDTRCQGDAASSVTYPYTTRQYIFLVRQSQIIANQTKIRGVSLDPLQLHAFT